MMYGNGNLPVTLPINATEDRVVGGWKINELMSGKAEKQEGLLEEANGKILYVDEVNLLDDHIVNIILDVTSTGVLVVQREGLREQKCVSFTLVGTMNPEEGGLRPQLLDRFGLMVSVRAEPENRADVLTRVLAFDEAMSLRKRGQRSQLLEDAARDDEAHKAKILKAHGRFYDVKVPESIARACVALATGFQAEGYRGDYVMLMAARAYAALQDAEAINIEALEKVAPLALQHRRPESLQTGRGLWTPKDDDHIKEILTNVS